MKNILNNKVFLLIIAINIAIYCWQIMGGIHWMQPELVDLISWGANVAPLTMIGEYWRLFSSIFVHGGLIHIALNMAMLFYCGRLIEQTFGSAGFTFVYIISGLFGSLASAYWYAQHKVQSINVFAPFPIATEQLQLVVSVGASGAIMGICGAYLAN